MVKGLAALRALVIAIMSLKVAGCATMTVRDRGKAEQTVRDTVKASQPDPCVVIWRQAYGSGNGGLELAVWPDGVILLSPWPQALGENLLAGRVDPSDLADALSCIREAGFQKLTRDWVVPDSDATTIAVTDEKVTHRSWHGCLFPGFGGDVNTDPGYRAFIRSWKKTHAAIEGLAPIELRRLEGLKEFRGYVVDAPEETPWRPR
jgi:hypothetical protein